jgi:hypothetical protein
MATDPVSTVASIADQLEIVKKRTKFLLEKYNLVDVGKKDTNATTVNDSTHVATAFGKDAMIDTLRQQLTTSNRIIEIKTKALSHLEFELFQMKQKFKNHNDSISRNETFDSEAEKDNSVISELLQQKEVMLIKRDHQIEQILNRLREVWEFLQTYVYIYTSVNLLGFQLLISMLAM